MDSALHFFLTFVGAALVVLVLWDAFEAIVLPRTPTNRFRLTRFFYQILWRPCAAVGRRLPAGSVREQFLSLFGPLSLLLLLVFWASGLLLGFALLHWGTDARAGEIHNFSTALYLSGTTFFTLGLGDVKPENVFSRVLVVVESGVGFGFLAIVISYLPVVYAAFSRREVAIVRLDVRAGSPPTAAELLRHQCRRGGATGLDAYLLECERWAAELLEAHLSYPILCQYRSQHRDQSWLAALVALLDTCALLIVGVEGAPSPQAPLTFAMARRAILDIAHLFNYAADDSTVTDPAGHVDRLPPAEAGRLRALLADAGTVLRSGPDADQKLRELREIYEPAARLLSAFLIMPLPPFLPAAEIADRSTSAANQLSEEQGAKDVSLL